MELTGWTNTFADNTVGGFPSKSSPYHHDLSENIPHHHLQEHHTLDSTPNNTNNNNMRFDQQSSNTSTPQLTNNGNTPSGFTETEQIFFNHFDPNLYTQQPQPAQPQQQQQQNQQPQNRQDHQQHYQSYGDQSHLAESSSNVVPQLPPPPQDYEFGLEAMNFMLPDDYDFGDNPSSAFPPTQQPQETPSLLAVNKQGDGGLGPSQEHSQPQLSQQQHHHHQQTQSNASNLFSPMLPGQNERSYNNQHYYHRQNLKIFSGNANTTIRPDVVFTPLASPSVTPLQKAAGGSSAGSSGGPNYQPPTQIAFEPLTSPALMAQQSTTTTPSDNRRRSATSAYGPAGNEGQGPGSSSSSSYKRRTPHGTPILLANNSASMKPRIEKLPLSSFTEDTVTGSGSVSVSSTSTRSKSTTPMLPPNGKPIVLNGSTTTTTTNTTTTATTNPSSTTVRNPSATPLMGFTMGRLAERLDEEENLDDNDNDDQLSSSTSTNSMNTGVSRKSSISSGVKKEKPAAKKALHKLAEQGRRNRMNMAVHELGSLIPQEYHDEVAIPSKATTVELALRYIRALLADIEGLKKELGREVG